MSETERVPLGISSRRALAICTPKNDPLPSRSWRDDAGFQPPAADGNRLGDHGHTVRAVRVAAQRGAYPAAQAA
eukprot:COSAG03_NODE_1183_length_4626_cov_6.043517_2_plen_74_part_00